VLDQLSGGSAGSGVLADSGAAVRRWL
jgi:hypothetical protein